MKRLCLLFIALIVTKLHYGDAYTTDSFTRPRTGTTRESSTTITNTAGDLFEIERTETTREKGTTYTTETTDSVATTRPGTTRERSTTYYPDEKTSRTNVGTTSATHHPTTGYPDYTTGRTEDYRTTTSGTDRFESTTNDRTTTHHPTTGYPDYTTGRTEDYRTTTSGTDRFESTTDDRTSASPPGGSFPGISTEHTEGSTYPHTTFLPTDMPTIDIPSLSGTRVRIRGNATIDGQFVKWNLVVRGADKQEHKKVEHVLCVSLTQTLDTNNGFKTCFLVNIEDGDSGKPEEVTATTEVVYNEDDVSNPKMRTTIGTTQPPI